MNPAIGRYRFKAARRAGAALLSASLLIACAAGCKCMKIDCQSAPTASLAAPPGLSAAGTGGGVRVQVTTLDIPVGRDVKVCAGYEVLSKDVTLEGTALIVYVNRQQALAIEYRQESGRKEVSRDIGSLLVPGKNEVSLVTVTYNLGFQGQDVKTRAACVILADGKKVVDDCYPVPDAAYAPITQSWTLAGPGGGGAR